MKKSIAVAFLLVLAVSLYAEETPVTPVAATVVVTLSVDGKDHEMTTDEAVALRDLLTKRLAGEADDAQPASPPRFVVTVREVKKRPRFPKGWPCCERREDPKP